jgi:hypothetical protein
MNCNQALELMLDAEPAELALAVESPLADHIRGCAKCSAVARRLFGVTRSIARVVEQEPALVVAVGARATRRRWSVGAGTALAAAATLALLVQGGGALVATDATTPSVIARSEPESTTADSAPKAADAPEPRLAPMPAAEQFRSVAFTSSRAVAPAIAETMTLPRNAELSGGISVAPPAGMHATVMTTSDPTVTVVWLHPADTTRSPR